MEIALIQDAQQVVAHTGISFSISFQHQSTRAGGRTFNVGQNKMQIRLLTLLILASPCMVTDSVYIVKMIDCEPKEEILISQTYQSFLDLIAKREVKKEELRFPVRLTTQNDNGVIFSRSFYISPNVLRGFEIFIPKGCVTEKNGLFVTTVGLVVDREETRQGIRCLILKRAQQIADGKTPEDLKPPH